MEAPLTFSYQQAGMPDDVRKSFFEKLRPTIGRLAVIAGNHDYTENESSISLPDDAAVLTDVEMVAKKLATKKLKYVFVIGIGGSSLGTKAIYDALLGSTDMLNVGQFPKLIFFDTNDNEYLSEFPAFIKENLTSLDECVVTLITKSGTTIEPIANAEYIVSVLTDQFGADIFKRVCMITDEGSPLWDVAQQKGSPRLSIPKPVGGRYSVLTAVGLLPLMLSGIDIREVRNGAVAARTSATADDADKNIAALSASVLMYQYQQKKSIHDTFIFHPELESIGKWYRQLMGESVGKEKDIHGKIVHAGMTPRASIGSTDLHSVGQLYLGGPKDKVTTFVRAKKSSRGAALPEKRFFPELVPSITGKTMNEIMAAIYEGVKIAYTKHELPYMEVVLSGITPYALGAFLQFKMIEMMYLGTLMEVNAFDQPNVESYKVETKRILMGE